MNTSNMTENESTLILKSLNIDHVIYVSLNTILITLGILGSISIFAAIYVSKELKSATSIIIANLAAADLMTGIGGPLSIIGELILV